MTGKKLFFFLFIPLFLIIVVFSFCRYQEVNRPYRNYQIVEKTEKIGRPFSHQEVAYIFQTPEVRSRDDYDLYVIPLVIENRSGQTVSFPIESFILLADHFQTQVDLEQFHSEPMNREAGQGIPPDGKKEFRLTFTLDKEDPSRDRVELYFLRYDGGKMYKHKLDLSGPH